MRDFPGSPVLKTLPPGAGGVGLIRVAGAKIPCASRPRNQTIKQKQYCNNAYCSIKPLKLINIKKNLKNVNRCIFMSYTEVGGIIGRCFLCIRRGWRVSKYKYWAYWIWCPCDTFR